MIDFVKDYIEILSYHIAGTAIVSAIYMFFTSIFYFGIVTMIKDFSLFRSKYVKHMVLITYLVACNIILVLAYNDSLSSIYSHTANGLDIIVPIIMTCNIILLSVLLLIRKRKNDGYNWLNGDIYPIVFILVCCVWIYKFVDLLNVDCCSGG